ncbi:MAG: TatD family hydrolase [Candidatus Moranbacteria bacterium]|nr:TatD family hydrolase [Candidatus Moranbacteria bacterium]
MSRLFDTHAHVNFNAFREDADEVLRRAIDGGIFVVNVGSQLSTSRRAVEYAKKYSGQGVYAAIGLHPIQLKKRSFEHRDDENDWELPVTEIKTIGETFDFEAYLGLARDPLVVAIGEVGLDYHHFEDGDDIPALKDEQKRVLREFVCLANEVGKPMMIHCWDAYDDLFELFDETSPDKRGIIHSFIGSHKTAKKFLELGWNLGVNGIATYSDSYDRLIREVPLERIVIETDCPYLAPFPHKGERNEPLLVRLVAEKIAAVKGVRFDEVTLVTTKNARDMFGLRG